MEARNKGITVILLTNPGAPARQLRVPRNWPIFLGMFSAISLCGSLFAGRQARALWESDEAVMAPQKAPATQDAAEPPLRTPSWAPSRGVDKEALSAFPATPAQQGLRGDRDTLLVATAGMGAAPRAEPKNLEPAQPKAMLPVAALSPLPLKGMEPGAPRPLLSGKVLSLFDVNAGRSLKVMPFDENGVPNADAFATLRNFMRCRRSGHEMDMDPKLIAVLSRIAQHFGGATLQVISGHRKPDGKVTRETSQHALGTAADIRVPGVSIETLKSAAKELGAKGIGLYSKSQFVHVDVRTKAYYWREAGEETGADLKADLPEALADKPALEPVAP